MKYNRCQSYLDLYCLNPEQISMLILKTSSGKIKGRAIIWKDVNIRLESWDKSQKEKVFLMDRIYSSEESVVEMFKIYAKTMGWIYKYRQDVGEEGPYIKDSQVVSNPKFFFYLENLVKSDRFPFMDSMSKYSLENGFISNKGFKDSICLQSTDGAYN